MISMNTLAELAEFYNVPVHALLPVSPAEAAPSREARVVLNLPALARVTAPTAQLLRRWVATIQGERDDYAGHVLSIRHGDLRALATLYTLPPEALLEQLRHWDVLDARTDLPHPTDRD
jgi:hypothetical protein